MGTAESRLMASEETGLVELSFTEEEIQRLFKRFIRIDRDQSNGLDTHEFMALEKVSDNPIASRFVQLFDKDKNGMVDFEEFLSGLSVFGKQGKLRDKLQFIFQLYDMNGDGFISNGDLFKALKMMAGHNLANGSLQQVVDKTMREADLDGDGRLSFEEFKVFAESKNRDLIERVSVSGFI